ncbi:hypothetical protein ABVT39_015666 [Epinephelus coioides]
MTPSQQSQHVSAASEKCRNPVINHRQEALSRADRLGQRGGGVFLDAHCVWTGRWRLCSQAGPLESGLVGTHPNRLMMRRRIKPSQQQRKANGHHLSINLLAVFT